MLPADTLMTTIFLGLFAVATVVVRAFRAGYAGIALSIVVEVILVVLAARHGSEAWIIAIGWGVIALLAALADVGSDLRRTLEAARAQPSRPSDGAPADAM